MNSYILKNQEPLSNRWGIEVVTFGNIMTFLGSSRTYGLLSISQAERSLIVSQVSLLAGGRGQGPGRGHNRETVSHNEM